MRNESLRNRSRSTGSDWTNKPGAKGQQDRNQTLREEDGRSRRSPRQRRISQSRARLRSRANETKRGAS